MGVAQYPHHPPPGYSWMCVPTTGYAWACVPQGAATPSASPMNHEPGSSETNQNAWGSNTKREDTRKRKHPVTPKGSGGSVAPRQMPNRRLSNRKGMSAEKVDEDDDAPEDKHKKWQKKRAEF